MEAAKLFVQHVGMINMEKFSIVIPTMWESDLIYQMLLKYEACEYVSEVIIINNSSCDEDLLKMSILFSSKFRLFSPKRNIYVNPSWNIGSIMAKDTIILANDDIMINDLDKLLLEISNTKYELIGATINNLSSNLNPVSIYHKSNGFPRKSFGCFMVCRQYIPIPESLKILCGDNWLFDHAETIGIIGAGFIHTPISVTIKSNPVFNEIGKRDKEIYRKIK